jgi:hypothetical protein
MPNKGKTHCKWGHEFTPENTALYPSTNSRRCKKCEVERQRKYRGWNPRRVLQPDPSVIKIQIVNRRCSECLAVFSTSHKNFEHPNCPRARVAA